jgi:hypothetical protein
MGRAQRGRSPVLVAGSVSSACGAGLGPHRRARPSGRCSVSPRTERPRFRGLFRWSVPGSNRRPPACESIRPCEWARVGEGIGHLKPVRRCRREPVRAGTSGSAGTALARKQRRPRRPLAFAGARSAARAWEGVRVGGLPASAEASRFRGAHGGRIGGRHLPRLRRERRSPPDT